MTDSQNLRFVTYQKNEETQRDHSRDGTNWDLD